MTNNAKEFNKLPAIAILFIMVGVMLGVGLTLLKDSEVDIMGESPITEALSVQVVVTNSTIVAYNSDSDTRGCSGLTIREIKMNKIVTSEFTAG
jgi:hypothetical protein